MKAILLAAVCVGCFVALVGAQERRDVPGRNEAAEEVARMERQVGEAIARRDLVFLEPLFADDFEATISNGQVLTKAQTLAQVTSPDIEVESLVNDAIRVRVFGDVAVVSARGVVRGRYRGRDASSTFRYLRIWVRRSGRWQAVAAQSTLVEARNSG